MKREKQAGFYSPPEIEIATMGANGDKTVFAQTKTIPQSNKERPAAVYGLVSQKEMTPVSDSKNREDGALAGGQIMTQTG